MDVAPTAVAALEEQEASFVAEIADHFPGFRILQDGPRRYGHYDIFAVAAEFISSFAVPSVLGVESLLVAQMRKGPKVFAHFENDVAAASAVAARRAAHRDIFFPAESRATVPALSRGNFYEGFIGKFDHTTA